LREWGTLFLLTYGAQTKKKMIVQFQIEYKTWFGQQMMIVGSIPQLGDGKKENAISMNYLENSNGIWTYQIELNGNARFSYRYFLKDHNFHTIIEEWGPGRNYNPSDHSLNSVLLIDHWRPMSDPDYALLSSAFTDAVFRQAVVSPVPGKPKKRKGIRLVFRPFISRIKSGHRVVVAGSPEMMGSWEDKKAVPLTNQDFPEWQCTMIVPPSEFPFRYKYLIQNEKGETVCWEKSPDRICRLPEGNLPDSIEIRNEKFDYPYFPWKGAGLAVPLFSLRREEGWGVGEFSDLKLLTDWAVQTGIRLIQILPVNDTIARHTWQDSYPYAAISVFALHPLYINLLQIGSLDSEITGRITAEQGKHLNQPGSVDYESVMALKSRYFKLIYDQQKKKFLTDTGFIEFFEHNKSWLKPYAAFSYLRDLFNTPDFTDWSGYTRVTDKILEELTDPASPHFDDIAVHYFIQYHAHLQLSDAAGYARSKGVVLKGDLPIGIFRNSVDAWVNPELYHMDCQAGAPADDFSATGQNWRFPTYNWEVMARDNYAWWQQRLLHLSEYFTAFRIDHILGFFRIWEIPESQVQGLMGYFNPSIPYTRNEILSGGIYFEEDRFCRPYIREHFLHDIFGEETSLVKKNFLREYAPGCYYLVPEADTQRKAEILLTPDKNMGAEERNRLEQLRDGLFSLISEVIFLIKQENGEKMYFPRNSFHSTHSYQELDYYSKIKLDELYIDYFYRRNENFWRGKAMTRLPAIKSATNMLLCGEDLGMVPACVPEVMNEMGILSLEVQRMPKDPKIEFGHPSNYPYLSVATPSSHDTSTIRGWWEENRDKTQRFYNQILGKPGIAPESCAPEIVRQIIIQHLYSPSMWAVFPIQDLLGMDENLRLADPRAERINDPGNPVHYWRYRLHLSLEELMEQKEFNERLRRMIEESGRLRTY
jgi:4-alpha-glucanotransferase